MNKLMKNVLAAITICVVAMPAVTQAEYIWKKFDYSSTVGAYGRYNDAAAVVKFGVWPVANGHEAGAVWTDNGWRTIRWAKAKWCWNQESPTIAGNWDEDWSVSWATSHYIPSGFEYALYVRDAYGNEYWDNNGGNNYYVETARKALRYEWVTGCRPRAY